MTTSAQVDDISLYGKLDYMLKSNAAVRLDDKFANDDYEILIAAILKLIESECNKARIDAIEGSSLCKP